MNELPARILSLLETPKAFVDEGIKSLANPPWDEARGRILILRLSPFADVSRSSTHLVLFSELRKSLPSAFIDFSFFPTRGERELLGSSSEAERPSEGLPWFYGIASGKGALAFDLILVSVSFGLELVNLPYVFSTTGLPMLASQRRALNPRPPLFILGGSASAALGPIVSAGGDSLADGIFFGEGEGAIGPLAAALLPNAQCAPALGAEALRAYGDVDSRLAAAGAIEGFWPILPPSVPRRRPEAHIRRLKGSPPPLIYPPLLNSPESGTARLQISAGCPGLCSFCFEGWDRRPYRELPLAAAVEAARRLKRATGADGLELYSFNFNTHSDIAQLVFELGRVYRRVNLMSQRLDILAGMPSLVQAELAADKRSFTLGIEGISARMRAYYRKGLSDEELEKLAVLLVAPGVKELKLFYIIEGNEKAADLGEFRAFVEGLDKQRQARAPGLRIIVSSGFLVRLPRTPLQFAPLALDPRRPMEVADSMAESCAAAGMDFRVAVHFDEYCADQVLSLGDGRLIPWLSSVPEKGFIYDGDLSRGAWASLESFAQKAGILDEEFLSEKTADYSPPLSFLSVDTDVLYREYREARKGRDREACLGEGCSGCGACPDEESMAFIGEHRIEAPDASLIERVGRLTAAKAAFKPLFVGVDLPEGLSGSTEAYKGAWLMRRLMATGDGTELALFEAREALFSPGKAFGLPEGFTGACAFALYGPKRERLAAMAEAAGCQVLGALPEPERAIISLFLPRVKGMEEGRDEEALDSFRAWIGQERVAATEFAEPEGRRFVTAARDAKKGVVSEARFHFGADATEIELALGSKAVLSDWLKGLGPRGRLARIRALSFE
jgi:radical SAM superfamily enzyme YgiQ (UPF0313 family)